MHGARAYGRGGVRLLGRDAAHHAGRVIQRPRGDHMAVSGADTKARHHARSGLQCAGPFDRSLLYGDHHLIAAHEPGRPGRIVLRERHGTACTEMMGLHRGEKLRAFRFDVALTGQA